MFTNGIVTKKICSILCFITLIISGCGGDDSESKNASEAIEASKWVSFKPNDIQEMWYFTNDDTCIAEINTTDIDCYLTRTELPLPASNYASLTKENINYIHSMDNSKSALTAVDQLNFHGNGRSFNISPSTSNMNTTIYSTNYFNQDVNISAVIATHGIKVFTSPTLTVKLLDGTNLMECNFNTFIFDAQHTGSCIYAGNLFVLDEYLDSLPKPKDFENLHGDRDELGTPLVALSKGEYSLVLLNWVLVKMNIDSL